MVHFDLHSHSTHSDGLLAPADLVRRAAARGVGVLALTDHDEVSGLHEAREAALQAGLRFVNGVELSVSWNDTTLHVLGLGIDDGNEALAAGLQAVREGRTERARRMAEALDAAGIPGSYEGALGYVTSERLISRTHFARYLVEQGHVRDMREVFKRYLTPGKPGYVEHRWATLAEAVAWIKAAGGRALIAHPGRYKLDRRALRSLLDEFKALGGDGIEVHTSSHTPAQFAEFARHARHYGFVASCGSDYHGPGESWMDFGELPQLPANLEPVWSDWPL
jgi:predicted metal-dependent phosphoesterase TrpH